MGAHLVTFLIKPEDKGVAQFHSPPLTSNLRENLFPFPINFKGDRTKMNGGGSRGLQQASGAANSSTSSAGKQPPQLQVLILKAKGKEIREKEEKAAVVRGLFSPPATMSRNRTMPVTRAEYEAVPEWKLQCLCSENGGLPSPIRSQLGGGFCF